MPLTDQDILDAIEQSFFSVEPRPGLIEHVPITGITGRYCPDISHPMVNLVGMARLTPDTVATTITQVQIFYAKRDLAFGWLVSPSNTPADLAGHLAAAGLEPLTEAAGMVLEDLGREFTVNPAIDVREADPTSALVADLFARGFPVPPEMVELMASMAAELGTRTFVAYLDDTPIAAASLNLLEERSIALLGGAATLPEQRGQGAYTALVARRLAEAQAAGMEAAIIQGDRTTSAPIVEKLGFQERCSLTIYALPS